MPTIITPPYVIGDVGGDTIEVVGGRLLVSATIDPIPSPPGSWVRLMEDRLLEGHGQYDVTYLVPTGQVIKLYKFMGCAASSAMGSAIEVYEDPTGSGSPLTLVSKMLLNGGVGIETLDDEFSGDGIRKIRIRLRRLDGGSRELFFKVDAVLQ